MSRCIVERVQRHPTDKKLARQVQCTLEHGHMRDCLFPVVPKEAPKKQTPFSRRKKCMTSVHMVPALAIGRCRCGEELCSPCMKRHLQDSETCVSWTPF